MGFLGDLANQINSQLGVGENTTTSLDAVIDGQKVKYGSLGDFANKIDQSAERRYVEEGFLRRDPYNADPKQFEVLMQEPNATILIKKSMFSSVNENYRPDYMDNDEMLYFQTMKVLFQNKCNQIAALEKLSKIQKITAAVGNISDQLMSVIIGLTDDGASGFNTGGFGLFGGPSQNGEMSNYTQVIEKIRRVYGFNQTNPVTTWITDQTQQLFSSTFGTGTGVMEITNFTTLNTTVTTDMKSPGGFSFTIADPYETMLITSWDIEKAIADATNAFYNNQTYQLGQSSAQIAVNNAQQRLNQLRAARGAGNVEIIVAPNTVINKRVRAIYERTGTEINFTYNGGFGGIGSSVNVDPQSLQGGAVAGNEGLSTGTNGIPGLGPDGNIKPLVPQSELAVFQQLITTTFDLLQLQTNSGNQFQLNNQNTNYTRRKLNFNFCGKLIIQPMDIAHIYINSKSRWDDRLLDGLQNMFTGNGILQNLNNTLTNLTNQFNSLFNPSGNLQFQSEKAAYVGADFPDSLWSLMRNQFVNEIEGTHVCAGLVETAPSNWSDGKFTITVTGRDNTAYFDLGKVNWKPGVDVFNGALFDPLTPFQSTFDTIATTQSQDTPELLPENQQLLGVSTDTSPPLLKFKLGPNAGQAARTDNIAQDNNVEPVSGAPQKIYYAPDGLVYKWKEGIGVLTQFGSSIDINSPTQTGAPALTKEPFAGQDVMNVISLLVTGQPYNFDTYWRAVSNFDGFNKDPQSQQDAAYSYYAGLRTDLTKNNATWGNFIPFKNLVIDDQTYAQQMQGQIRAINRNKQLDDALKQYSELMRQANVFGVASTADPSNPNNNQYSADKIKAETLANNLQSNVIKPIIAALQQEDQLSNSLGPTGDPSFLPGTFGDPQDPTISASEGTARRLFRRQVNQLTRRMSYNVRANEDKNLFIVDDAYDKDYDIVAYEESLADGIKLYNNEFQSVKDKISVTADLLNLEVFADTQGHIRVRSPQYNRMPSSIFYRMMYLKTAYNIQIYPQFLQDLFSNQINTLTRRVEVLENQIRLCCAVMGFLTDKDCIDFILNGVNSGSGTGLNSAGNVGVLMSGEVFGFISNEGQPPNYSFAITDMATVLNSANPDTSDVVAQSLTSQATSTKTPFSNTERYQIIDEAFTTNSVAQTGAQVTSPTPFASNPRINALVQAIRTATGQQIPNDYFLITTSLFDNGVNIPAGQSLDVFKITNDLSKYIRERQKVIKLLYNSVLNSQEAQSLDNSSNTANDMLTPGLYGNSNIPEVFEHMIEDETYDDYGPQSGTRYVIRRGQIRSLQLAETPPDFTYIEVKGQLDPLLANTTLPGELNNFPQGGNGLVTAAAVDYDLWRKYGFRQQSPISVPFLRDPNSQCAPYASMILSRARRNILRGTLTISGNEFMQPGEVIYLQDREMLFYVTSVKHQFNYGSGFTTTLDLNYGHTPGEYIPNTLDVIGKMLYSNADIANTNIFRQSSSLNENNIGVIVKDPFMTDAAGNPTTQTGNNPTVINTGDSESTYQNQYTGFNARTLNNILYQAAYMINANSTQGNTVEANVELRIYYDSTTGSAVSDLNTFAGSVLSTLTQPSGPIQPFNSTTGTTPPSIPTDNISIVAIQLDDPNVLNAPSQKALSMARSMVKQNNSSGGSVNSSTPSSSQYQQQVRNNLYNYVVDCWISFTQVPANVAGSTTGV